MESATRVQFPSPSSYSSDFTCSGFASNTSYEHKRKSNNPLRLSYCVTPSVKRFMVVQEYQPAVHRLCIFRLGLGPDLPWDDDRCPGNLRLSVDKILTCLFATHTNILTSCQSTTPYGIASAQQERSPTHCHKDNATASVLCLSPGNFRRRGARPVSYYALFKWWLLLSQHPGCLCNCTSFST